MEFSHVVQDGVLVITIQDDNLDATTATAFKEKIWELIQQLGMTKVVLDLSHLGFIDSSGLGAFLSTQRLLSKQGGALKLAQLSKSVQTMFEIVSMHRIFEIFPTVDDAIKSF